jgi:hypothetical protein
MLRWLLVLLVGVAGGSALAQGPLDSPIPANTCARQEKLKLLWIASEVHACAGAGPGYAEMMVVCHSVERTGGDNVDIWVEMFDAGGASTGSTHACDVPPGTSATFVTLPPGFLPEPYVPSPGVEPFPSPPSVTSPGSLRILATTPSVVCEVSLFDTFGFYLGLPMGPLWSEDLTLTRVKSSEKGD